MPMVVQMCGMATTTLELTEMGRFGLLPPVVAIVRRLVMLSVGEAIAGIN